MVLLTLLWLQQSLKEQVHQEQMSLPIEIELITLPKVWVGPPGPQPLLNPVLLTHPLLPHHRHPPMSAV